MTDLCVSFTDFCKSDLAFFFVGCGAYAGVGGVGGEEDVFGKVEICALEPVGI